MVYTPEIRLGSATEPSIVTVPPIEEVTPNPPEEHVSNAPPASTELLSTRHFDFITAPMAEGPPRQYGRHLHQPWRNHRQLRAGKGKIILSSTPNAIAQPANPK